MVAGHRSIGREAPLEPDFGGVLGANASRRSSDGPRRRPGCARPVIVGWLASVGSLPLPPPPITLSVCRNYWARRRSDARIAPPCRARRQNPVREPFQYHAHAIIACIGAPHSKIGPNFPPFSAPC